MRVAVLAGVCGLVLTGLPARSAQADVSAAAAQAPRSATKSRPAPLSRASCLRALDRLGVRYARVKRRTVDIAVAIDSVLGGVRYRSIGSKKLVVDCSLAVSLAEAGRFLTGHGIDTAQFSSALEIRNIRGTRRRSQHSFGLAIDVHSFAGPTLGKLRIVDDYEQGLGDEIDCVGQPMTEEAMVLRTVSCQLARSGLFRNILDPDFDGSHENHFHIEARPWKQRHDFDENGARVIPK